MPNFNMGFTIYWTCLESLKNHYAVVSAVHFSHNRPEWSYFTEPQWKILVKLQKFGGEMLKRVRNITSQNMQVLCVILVRSKIGTIFRPEHGPNFST